MRDDPAEAAAGEALARAAVARYGVTAGGVSLRFVRHGENTTFRVDVPDGRAYALRLSRPRYQTAASIRSEVEWMESLNEAGITTPQAIRGLDGDVAQVVHGKDGTDRLVALFTWVDGVPLGQLEARPGLWQRLGELMAALHEHSVGWEPPSGFTRHAWDVEGMLGEAPLWGDPRKLWRWDRDTDGLIGACQDEVRRRLASFGHEPERSGLIHADVAFDNVLVGEGGAPVLIDFDDAGTGWFLYDLAVPLFPHEGGEQFCARRDALVAGYRRRRALPDAELAELPTFLMARRLVTLGWTFSHAETHHASRQRAWRVETFPRAAQAFLRWSADTRDVFS